MSAWSRVRALGRKRWFRVVVAVAVAVGGYRVARKPLLLPSPPKPDAETFAQAQRVRIVRDTWGVPHVFGKSDADAAFGLAYANAEDDFPMVQGVLAASSGRLAQLSLSKVALANDYYVGLFRIREQVDAEYDALSPDFRAVLEGYARGINLYAYLHPKEADGRLYPVTGKTIAAGFAHKIPLMFDIGKTVGALVEGPPRHAGSMLLARGEDRTRDADSAFPGSNAHAVSASRSSDGVTRLNVNSHQPWEGPVTWYEAHVTSEEGWNMSGALFPGAPLVLHGHNDHLGWAHTVNRPDLVDVYELERDPKAPGTYVLDGKNVPLEETQAPITIDTGFFDVTVHKPVHHSVHGPVVVTEHGAWAIRYAGIGRSLRAGEQWFRMNKAKDLASWRAAMEMQAIPMFNTVYADREHIFYVYNALIPRRPLGPDWRGIVSGSRSELVWNDYLTFAELPQVLDPRSGFVQNCNSAPWSTTTGQDNPSPSSMPESADVEPFVTNRTWRSLALFGGMKPISREDFLRFKWDRVYSPESTLFRDVIRPLDGMATESDAEREALAIVKAWDGVAEEASTGATIAILAWRMVRPDYTGAEGAPGPTDARTAFKLAVQWLLQHYGKVAVPLGEVQRLVRGKTNLPLGGGPDVLNGIATKNKDRLLVGHQGDSFVMFVELGKDFVVSSSIHQYGASNRPESKHYSDQSELFVKHELKPTWRAPKVLAQHTERSYVPGEER
ncbi:MAG: penicillin acylase family protein [Deltaproteobacteria bacterium]|nr:penicillin acylase family protein [Deltaproteobacteria bacterium]